LWTINIFNYKFFSVPADSESKLQSKKKVKEFRSEKNYKNVKMNARLCERMAEKEK